MNSQLIQGQGLINQFLGFLSTTNQAPANTPTLLNIRPRTGPLDKKDISAHLQNELPEFFTDTSMLVGEEWRDLYNGSIAGYEHDNSRADLALAGYLARQGLIADEIDQVMRTSALYRAKWDSTRGTSTWLHQYVIARVVNQSDITTDLKDNDANGNASPESEYGIGQYKPCFIAGGMPPRTFAGPTINGSLKLYPLHALSTVVALGAVGKTSLLIGHACHIAAGKPWNHQSIVQRKVIYFSVEETQEELTRKFCAITQNWSDEERKRVIENLLLVPMLGQDVRLVTNERGSYQGSGMAERMIGVAHEFDLEDGVIFLDHMQGFASGDLNSSETATAICREANKIAEKTGAAVVFAAHISKANIKATSIEQGFAVGSLAFENALRQMVGIITMSEEDAKKYGITQDHRQYSRLEVPKNSYGPSDGGIWLRKVHSADYHTVVVEPVQLTLPAPQSIKSSSDRLLEDLLTHLRTNQWITRNQLDGLSGKDGKFKVSKSRLRDVVAAGIDTGSIIVHTVSPEDRDANGLAKQVKEVLRACS